MLPPMTETIVQAIAQDLYGAEPAVTRFWSEVNDVYLLTFPGRQSDKVMKCARAGRGEGIRREQAILRSLRSLAMPAPAVEFTQEDHPGCAPFTLMPRLGQRHLGEWHGAEPTSPAIARAFRWLGHFLAQLHQIEPAAIAGARTAQEAWSREQQQWSSLSAGMGKFFPGCDPGRRVLEQVHSLLRQMPGRFVHHDLHCANALVDGETVCAVIDWENAGAGYSFRDLGRCLAATRIWGGRAQDILQGYQEAHPLDASSRAELETWQAYAVLDFAISYAASGRAEAAATILAKLDASGELGK